MRMAMSYFLLVYNKVHGALETVQQFADRDEAARAYTATERAAHGSPALEIVLIGADSLDTIRQTHGQYFAARSGQSEYLKAIADTQKAAPVPAG